ncbi:cell wall metabolism sensor histidine kinase WalK [Demequina sp. NBRC 110052]|uniref:sensor histidine kinase n=1 Tax=Demequina sp. NBRC 110052 TaxID=1570341 RepID=UPI000A06921D|nr:HAMP domain-containing sensor histidine kinase [Demequina sp. NBRC 110052]
MRSIRARLTLALSAITLVIVLGAAGIGSIAIPRVLEQRDTDRLTTAAARSIASLEATGGAVLIEGSLTGVAGDALGVVLVADDMPIAAAGVASEDSPALSSVTSSDPVKVAEHYLAVGIDVADLNLVFSDGDGSVTVDRAVLAVRTADREAAVSEIATWLLLGAVAVTSLLIGVATVVVARGLRPLDDMADRAQRIADGDRTLRLASDDAADPSIARTARTVNAALDAQELAERRLRSFLADASHELRTPLTTASGWVDLYLRGGLDDRARLDDAMTRVDAQLTRMRLMTDEMLQLARTDAGRPLEREAVDLAQVARDVVEDARVASPERRIDIEAREPAIVSGDEPRLAQVLRNLVGNAAQHTAADARIAVIVTPGADHHTVTVVDTGAGIPATDLPHLFDRFWRGGSARSAKGGAGLGLAIVRSLVEAHEGSVVVSSIVGTGTEFTVTLPAAR